MNVMNSKIDPLYLDTKDEDFSEQEINEDIQIANQNLINVEDSEARTETEHLVSGFPESKSDVERSETILKENIECDCEIINPKYETIGDGRGRCLHIQHFGWQGRLRLCEPWPKSCSSLSLYQVCKSKHFITYQNGKDKIVQESVFYDPEFESNLIFEGNVVDKDPEYENNELFYCHILGNDYSQNDCFQFDDHPWDKYPLTHQKYERFHLAVVSKEQEFLLCLVSVDQNLERPLICWKICETFKYSREKADDNIEENIEYNIEGPVEVDVSEFPLDQLKLPSANNRQFVIQYGNPPLGIKQKAVTIPEVLPDNCNKDEELFKKKIREIRRVRKWIH